MLVKVAPVDMRLIDERQASAICIYMCCVFVQVRSYSSTVISKTTNRARKSNYPHENVRDPITHPWPTVYPKKYAHGFCFAVLCCGYTLTDFPISTRLTSLALWQSNDCPSASKATLMNMDKYFMWIHYERLRNNNKAKHSKTEV